jgi:hypothetical protein
MTVPTYLRFLIGIVGGGGVAVQLGPLGTAANNRPIVPAPGDYDDGEIGEMNGRGNRSTRRKPAPMPRCPPETPHAIPGRRGGKPATNRLSYGTASSMFLDNSRKLREFKNLITKTISLICSSLNFIVNITYTRAIRKVISGYFRQQI